MTLRNLSGERVSFSNAGPKPDFKKHCTMNQHSVAQ